MTFLISAIAGLLLFINLLLNFPAVQTWLTHRISNYYSSKLHAKVSVGRVDFEFLKKLVLKNVYVEDQHSDTLFYTELLKLDIGQISFKNHQLYLSDIILENTKLHLTQYKKDSSLNLQFIVNAFSSKDTTKSPAPGPGWKIAFGKLSLINVDFHLRNLNDTSVSTGFNSSDLWAHHINSSINNIKISGDTIRATIVRLSAVEQNGFNLDKFSCYVKLSPRGMELDALHIQTPKTELSTDLLFTYKSFSDFNDFVNKVNMKADFHKSKVCFDDIAYFAHGLSGVHNTFTFSGEYKGTVSHLKAHNMAIGWGKISELKGEAIIDSLPDIDHTLFNVKVSQFITNRAEIEGLPAPPFDKTDHITLPDNMALLKTVDLNGYFVGYISSFKTSGNLSTAIGDISANLKMWEEPGSDIPNYTGEFQTKEFDLGKFWNNDDLGTLTASLSVEGKGLKTENADAALKGTVADFTFKKYVYRNILMNGELRKGFFKGGVNINDSHCNLDFDGEVDLTNKQHLYHFNAHIDKTDLAALHFIKDTNGSALLKSHIKVNMKGGNPENLAGTFYMDSTNFTFKNSYYSLKSLSLSSEVKGNYHDIHLESDYADGELSGHFSLAKTTECLRNLMSSFIPTIFPKEKHTKGDEDYHDYNLSLHINQDTGLTRLFAVKLKLSPGTDLKGIYKENSGEFGFNCSSPEIGYAGRRLKNMDITASGDLSALKFDGTGDTLFVNDSIYAAGFSLKGTVKEDTIHYVIGWNNDSANFANIPGYVGFPTASRVVFKLIHPFVSISDSTWKINNENFVSIDSSRINFHSLKIYHSLLSSIELNGSISHNHNDALMVNLSDFNLANFNGGNTSIKGIVSGTATVSNIFERPFFTSDLNFINLAFNNEYLGDGNLASVWDTLTQSIAVDGKFTYHGDKLLAVKGNYFPNRDLNNLSASVAVNDIPVKLFQPYTTGICSKMDGNVTGNLNVSGSTNKPLIKGDLNITLKQIRLDYLNTIYHSPGLSVSVYPDTIVVNSSPLVDQKNDTAYVSGSLTHNNFKDFNLDFSLDAHNFQCLNTLNATQAQNSSYYGIGYATGNVHIYGIPNSLQIDANITTDKNTIFTIPLNTASDVEQGDYIQFVNRHSKKKNANEYQLNPGGIALNFTLHVTPDAKASIIFSSDGEILESTGSGTIQLFMSNFGEISMYGDYTVKDGSYTFVLLNIINKQFKLQEGGTIQWSGSPLNADIDLTTYYRTFTSLEPFFPSDVTGTQYSKNVPVNCDLNLEGKLASPNITFGIELPTTDEDTKQVVASYLTNEDQLKTQVFSLLIVNSFAPVQGASLGGSPVSGLGANTIGGLSNQLTGWINKMNQNVNIGVQYQPGSTMNPQEVKVAVSTELANGRVAITTNVGTISGGPAVSENNNSNLVGEVTVEYKVNKKGKLKVKGYNKANDNLATAEVLSAPYTQGIGLSYREGFNTWEELWERIKNDFKASPKQAKPKDEN